MTDLCNIIGVKGDGTEVLLGQGSQSPQSKSRDILRSYGFEDFDNEGSEASYALVAVEELIGWMVEVGWKAPPLVTIPAVIPDVLAKKRIYIAGPMTGLPEFNYPAFNKEAQRLRSLGYEVENPAENPEPPCKSWAMYMRMAVIQLATCHCVALLPGWETSKSARIEHRLGLDLGLQVVSVSAILDGPHD